MYIRFYAKISTDTPRAKITYFLVVRHVDRLDPV